MDARQERIGRNEILFREINERLEEMQERFGVLADRAEFVCECGDAGCTEQISMSLTEYQRVRQDARTFAVVAGHEIPDVEAVVARHEGYLVVRKVATDAARLAQANNPRP